MPRQNYILADALGTWSRVFAPLREEPKEVQRLYRREAKIVPL